MFSAKRRGNFAGYTLQDTSSGSVLRIMGRRLGKHAAEADEFEVWNGPRGKGNLREYRLSKYQQVGTSSRIRVEETAGVHQELCHIDEALIQSVLGELNEKQTKSL